MTFSNNSEVNFKGKPENVNKIFYPCHIYFLFLLRQNKIIALLEEKRDVKFSR